MSKRITTRWYIGAWIVWALGVLGLFLLSKLGGSTTSPPQGVFVDYAIMFVAALVMLLTWLVALLKLGMQRAWPWFVAVLVLHVVGLGVIGMAAYAMAGPDGGRAEVVYRPSAT